MRAVNIYLTLVSLILLGISAQSAPTKGRRMWLRCKPDSKDANCVTEKGPWIDLPEPNRLPFADSKMSEDQSDDGSRTGPAFIEIGSGDQWEKDGPELGITQLEEASADGSPEFDYSDFVFPEKVYRKENLHREFQEENLIL